MQCGFQDASTAACGRYERDMEVLAAISRLLATQSGQQQMLSAVLAELEKTLGMLRGTILLLSPNGQELLVEAVRDLEQGNQREVRYQLGEGIVGAVVQTGHPAIVPRVSAEPRFANRIHRREEGEDKDLSFVCVPIALGSEVVGTLSVDLPLEDIAELDEQCRFLGSWPA